MIQWTLILAVSLTPAVRGGQRATSAGQQPVDAKTLGLQLTVAISDEKFCAGDADIYTEVFDLATRYTNTGTNKLTVFTGTDVPARVFVARTAEDLKAAKYEAELNGESFPMDGGRYMLGSDLKKERSAALEPGESVVSKTSIAVLVRRLESANIPGTVASGEHFLQVQMQTKVSQGDTGNQIGPRRRQPPSFQWVSIRSETVQFEAPLSPALQHCAK